MDFTKSIAVAASGLRAQAGRMRIISENIANADSTASTASADPYRRRIATFTSQLDRELDARVVGTGRARPDMSEFQSKYQPSHPAADAKGYVKYPERELAGGNDRHARGAAILRSEHERHRRRAPDDPAHP